MEDLLSTSGDKLDELTQRSFQREIASVSSDSNSWMEGFSGKKEGAGTVSRWERDEDSHFIHRIDSTCDDDEFGRRRLRRAVPRVHSLDVELMEVPGVPNIDIKDHTLGITLRLAFQSIGIVYGNVGTSPLYVYSNSFNKFNDITTDDILGALSIIIYTTAIIPLVKYTFIVLRAENNRESDFKGGTFSLYSLICRFAKVNMIPNRQPEDEHLSNFQILLPTKRLERALKIKEKMEDNMFWKNVLLIMVLLGASLVIANGILTPCISVKSAVSGLKVAVPAISQDMLVAICFIILLLLFSLQRFGTSKVIFLFAPVLSVWFVAIGLTGLYNICNHNPGVLRAFNPMYIYFFFKRNDYQAWYVLGGLMLSITGGEAMFSDLGHFSLRSLQISFCSVIYPCLLLSYMGQAAYLVKNPSGIDNAFYRSIPDLVYWPIFAVAIAATLIASQAMISATSSVIKTAVAMDCFPRIKVVHTSKRFIGQIYVPVLNWFLMIICLVITACFRDTNQIASAYGIAVIGDMLVTTCLITLIMAMVWQTTLLFALGFFFIIGSVELIYLSAVLLKVNQGGWVPLVLSVILVLIMYVWNYGTRMKYQSEVTHKISMKYMLELSSNLGTVRVPGVGLLYNELVHGVPAVFGYFIKSLPAIHSTVIFICIKYVPVPKVPQSERFLFRRVGPRDYHLFRCVVRYGYKDVRKEDHNIFEQLLVQSLVTFLYSEARDIALEADDYRIEDDDDEYESACVAKGARVSLPSSSSSDPLKVPLISKQQTPTPSIFDETSDNVSAELTQDLYRMDRNAAMEVSYLQQAKEAGFVYLLGNADVRAKKESFFLKKLVINYLYAFLARNCRPSTEALSVPHTNLMQVGMTYMV